MDIRTLINQMMDEREASRVVTNPRAQFGTPSRRYLGATILPERTVAENAFREEMIRYRTVIANNGTRYSPAQKKGGALVGSMEVFLAESDIASEFTSHEYDTLLQYLRSNQTMEAIASLTRWLDRAINIPLVEKNELYRWQALINAQVTLTGNNGYSDTVNYSNPAGHRAAAGGQWSNNAYDPYDDILGMVQLLTDKGFSGFRFVTSRKVVGILSMNDKMKARGGVAVINPSGQITSAAGRITLDVLNGIFQQDGLPPIETYDLQYRTSTGSARFMPDNVFVILARTGRDEELDLGDEEESEILPDTLGYVGVGRPAGSASAGRMVNMEAFSNKPPRIEAEGWQTSLAVVTEPEAVAVINTIS